MDVVAVDIGGTHARFAVATVGDGHVHAMGEAVTLKTADHVSFQRAWEEFARLYGNPLPPAAAIAIAGVVTEDLIRCTNNTWSILQSTLAQTLGLDEFLLINDFGAVGHAVAQTGDEHFTHICGPDRSLPNAGVISVIGPGTGLGVSYIVRDGDQYWVRETQGGHIDFAPIDAIDDALLARLRRRHTRVSAERIVSGPAIVDIYQTLAAIEGRAVEQIDDKIVWTRAIYAEDSLAVAAMERFCLSLGSVAGDIALAQGASAVVIAGGLGQRVQSALLTSGFAERFRAKGRFQAMMEKLPVKLITYPQPGLFGAAAAFAKEHV